MSGTRRFVVVGVVLAFLVAGVASFYASTRPDGLERVAEQTGFRDTAAKHPGTDQPLAGYQTKGVRNPRLSGGLAGVVGVLATLAVMGGLVLVLRRTPDDRDA